MESTLPKRWRTMNDWNRDILLELFLQGEMSGAELFDVTGGTDGRKSKGNMHVQLTGLRDAGLVECRERDGRTNDYAVSGQGKMLLHRVAEEWEVILRG